ncbi:MinD/ParA family protein [Mycobacterium sp. E2989]|uniref:MinD/ParA family ATP-binding protein n=1 Tax=Mycobacterium sp. E2989 TaxID=1834140 RepID=UPI0007FFBB89|nr:MinD/ParA family protein [Mycobacterium sp. E2989]OBH83026.1 cobalamin biosynthesis protein CobB [Mycobacterium sp. E2989]
MRNRGSIRGDVQQPASSAGPPRPPVRPQRAPSWRDVDSRAATMPQSYRAMPSLPRPKTPARPERLVPRPRAPRPAGGTALDGLEQGDPSASAGFNWRDVIHRVTGVDLGPGKAAQYMDDLRDRIRVDVGGAFPIAVLNLKGGVGKTAVVEALGSTFAEVRHDRIVAVDIDAGDLAERHGRPNPLGMADLLTDKTATSYADIRAHTYMNNFGLEVLGLPDYAHTDWRLERHDVVKAFSLLRNHYSVVLLDCAKALNSGVMDAVLPEARALVVVTSTSIDAIRKTATTLDWLGNNGYQALVRCTILAVNHVEPAKVEVLAANEIDRLSARVAATVVLPFDRHIHEGKQIELDRLSKESRRCYLEMAAVLADMFPGRGAVPSRFPVSRSPHWP